MRRLARVVYTRYARHMTNIDRLTARIDRVHADIRRNPSERAAFAPFLRELEAKLAKAVAK